MLKSGSQNGHFLGQTLLAREQSNCVTAKPLVTAIVLSYNQSRFVCETLESVRAQTHQAMQLIVVDDCSSDSSVAIIDHWIGKHKIDCTFIRHQENRGICKSLNDALAVANGKYISMVAADDVWLPDKIEQQLKIMESQPDSVGVLYSDAFLMDEHSRALPGTFIRDAGRVGKIPQGQILDMLLEGNFIPGMTSLIRRTCYDVVGIYDENLPWEDWDMWMRIARHYLFIYSPIPSAKYRRHQSSLWHSDPGRMAKDSFTICLKQLRVGHLNNYQQLLLIRTMLHLAQLLYSRKDPALCDALLALWRATSDRRAGCLYLFAKCGFSYRHWQRANRWRIKFRQFGCKIFNPQRPSSQSPIEPTPRLEQIV